MVPLQTLAAWLEHEMQKLGGEQEEQQIRSEIYQIALASIPRHRSAKEIADVLKVRSSVENDPATLEEVQKIRAYIEQSYTWEIWREDPPERIEGPSQHFQDLWITAVQLWGQTQQSHRAVLVGSEQHQRLLEQVATQESKR